MRRTGSGSLTGAAVVVAALALGWPLGAAASCPSSPTTRVIPLPVYATLPNEGSTWGVMPVLIRVCPDDQRTESIIAPSATWNSVIHYTGTFRWYRYPSDVSTVVLILSASTRINYNGLFVWQYAPPEAGRMTEEVTLRVQRSAFYRFFGFGPETSASAETSYTRFRALADLRHGINLTRHLNLGATLGVERDGVEARGVPGLPLSRDAFPAAPGMAGATLLAQGLSLRYDDRPRGDYSERGVLAEVSGEVVEGLSGSPAFFRGGAELRGVFAELPGLSGAARISWTGVSSSRAPFYAQSTLGGAFLLRGYTEDRFIDRQAWTVELEQRIRVLQTQIFGVVADWRIDPFVAAGQVFGDAHDVVAHPRLAAGIGFRAFVHPNVLGRVDVAEGGEGIKVYVELGYPY